MEEGGFAGCLGGDHFLPSMDTGDPGSWLRRGLGCALWIPQVPGLRDQPELTALTALGLRPAGSRRQPQDGRPVACHRSSLFTPGGSCCPWEPWLTQGCDCWPSTWGYCSPLTHHVRRLHDVALTAVLAAAPAGRWGQTEVHGAGPPVETCQGESGEAVGAPKAPEEASGLKGRTQT